MSIDNGENIKLARLCGGFVQRELTHLQKYPVLFPNEIERIKRPSPIQNFLEKVGGLLELKYGKYNNLASLSENGLCHDVLKYLFKNTSVLNLVLKIGNFTLILGQAKSTVGDFPKNLHYRYLERYD